jgi:hypothetical protein
MPFCRGGLQVVNSPASNSRADRYRKIANAELDGERAALLYKLADEADRDILCSVDRIAVPELQ